MSYDGHLITMDQMIDLIVIITAKGWTKNIKEFMFYDYYADPEPGAVSNINAQTRCDIEFVDGHLEQLWWWPKEQNQNDTSKLGMFRFHRP